MASVDAALAPDNPDRYADSGDSGGAGGSDNSANTNVGIVGIVGIIPTCCTERTDTPRTTSELKPDKPDNPDTPSAPSVDWSQDVADRPIPGPGGASGAPTIDMARVFETLREEARARAVERERANAPREGGDEARPAAALHRARPGRGVSVASAEDTNAGMNAILRERAGLQVRRVQQAAPPSTPDASQSPGSADGGATDASRRPAAPSGNETMNEALRSRGRGDSWTSDPVRGGGGGR